MENIYGLLGILTVFFAVLAATNAMKKYTSNKVIRAIAKKHKIYGVHAVVFGMAHMILAVIDGELRLTGILVLSTLFLTALFGGLFYRLKKKTFFMVHRSLAILSLIFIILHIIFNSSI
jgi:DMSO/TMAO reductase YedYZ heme-binding membrane subunit